MHARSPNIMCLGVPAAFAGAALLTPFYGLAAQVHSTAECAQVVSSTATLADLLQGRVPGVTVVQNGGSSMGARQIRIRGINSTHAGNPVILVDDVRVTPIGHMGDRGMHSVSLLEVVDPTFISRVEVLRGPAASIQYGDAADGVIRIYTRRGNEQPVIPTGQRTDCKPSARRP